jgi:3-phenylpropionate/cinnamic acid dioxygenase small subunit
VLTDTDRIRNLLGTYCELVDSADFAGVGALFARGAMGGLNGSPFAVGAAAVEGWYRDGLTVHDGTLRTRHLVTNSVFDEPAADGAVIVRSAYLVLQAVDGLPLQPIITGRYVDRFERDEDGTWYFAERRFTADLVGDLSRHWAGPVA